MIDRKYKLCKSERKSDGGQIEKTDGFYYGS